MTWPAVVFWILILWAATSRGPGVLYLFAVSGAFGTLQMIPGEIVGGVNVVPQFVCASVLVGKVFAAKGNLLRGLAAAIDTRRMALFVAFLVFAAPVSLALPRLFAEQLEITTLAAPISGMQLLRPTLSNMTQVGYFGLSVALGVAFSVVGSRTDFQRHYLWSLLLAGVVLVLTGLADLVTYQVGLADLLDPFRNATYALLTDVETLGAKRVVGLMPEASSFGSLCVSTIAALLFLRPCFEPQLRRWVVPPTIAALTMMALMSTSTGSYIGLTVLGMAYGVNWLIRAATPDAVARGSLGWELTAVLVASFLGLAVVALEPSVLQPVYDVFDHVVLQKSSSSSYVERNSWTQSAWNAVVATGGLGVGLGAARTSNWYVSIISNTGVVGALLLFAFIGQCMVGQGASATPRQREWRRGLRCSLLPSLFMSWFIGTTPDIGVASASILGLLRTDPEIRRSARRIGAA